MALFVSLLFSAVAFFGVGFFALIIHFTDSPGGKLGLADWWRSFELSLILGAFPAALGSGIIYALTKSRVWFFVALTTILLASVGVAILTY